MPPFSVPAPWLGKDMRNFIKIVFAVAVVLVSANASARDRLVTYEQLPQTAKTFVTTHFADQKVSYAKIDDGKYEVKLADGSELEFTKAGEWIKADCKYSAMPASVVALVPAGIPLAVKERFPDAVIVKIDKGWRNIEIELDNDLELVFNKKGELVRIDD